MKQIRKSGDRGMGDLGWLNSHHSFSFGHYQDPEHMGFGPLRVINEDVVRGGQGFGTHGHRDMEIISYVLHGALEHKDSMGNGSVLIPGDVQRMSAGTGVRHSEFNHAESEPLHFLQIWIEPNVQGIAPGYEEKHFTPGSTKGQLRLIASPDGRNGSVLVHQDASVYASILDGTDEVEHQLVAARNAYVHVVRGRLVVNDITLSAGDALKITGEDRVKLNAAEAAEILLFDLPS
jgi:redox-sensitive bicupin YhaK (pirin superfamily)